MSYDNNDKNTITINNECNNALKYFPKVKSNFELVSKFQKIQKINLHLLKKKANKENVKM